MPGKFPDLIDPKRLAQQGVALDGEIAAGSLGRLSAAYTILGPVRLHLEFSQTERRRPHIVGRLHVRVAGQCQRCLSAFETEIAADVDLEIGESPRDSDQEFELVLRPDEPLNVSDLVEDELLLNAPMFPVHPANLCRPPGAEEADSAPVDTRRPAFADLQAMIDRSKS